jgi:GTP cyclohydrolase I
MEVLALDVLCVKSRGLNDVNSQTITSSYNGKFLEAETRNIFLSRHCAYNYNGKKISKLS